MSLACSSIHKKPVCNKCDAGTNCVKCCTCHPRTRGRPRKERALSASEPDRLNPERLARVHHGEETQDVDDMEGIPVAGVDDPIEHASQAHILKVIELMDGKVGHAHESSIRRLPHIDIRRDVRSGREINPADMMRVENVFRKGVKSLALMLLPNLRLKPDGELKMACSIQSMMTTIHVEEAEESDNPATSCVPSSSISINGLNSIPNAIRDMLKHERRYTTIAARKLLVPLSDLSQAHVASLLSISNSYAGCLLFQAKVDKLYITHGISIQEYSQTQSHVPRDSVAFAVGFIYCDDNICRLAWQAKKRSPNRKQRWKGLDHVFAMRSLVLKRDVATMYRDYLVKQREAMPGKSPIGQTLFYTIVKHITGGGKQQEARAGVDYIKVNFHSDNFTIIDRVIDILAPLSDIDHTLRNELHHLRSEVFTFLSYGYAVHARKGVEASSEVTTEHIHQPQDHEVERLRLYRKLEDLLSQPDLFDESATQDEFVDTVRAQLQVCAQAKRSVVELTEVDCATTHSPVFSLDLASDRRPNRNPKSGGHLDCSSCLCTFLFYDKLRSVALAKLDEDPNRQAVIADVLHTIYQCERRSYRYMAHVMLAAQQAHHMKLAVAQMDSSTAYVVFDFKQKFLAKGFREGGDSYYGKKGILWWGAGVYVKPHTGEAALGSGTARQQYVEIDFTTDVERMQRKELDNEHAEEVESIVVEGVIEEDMVEEGVQESEDEQETEGKHDEDEHNVGECEEGECAEGECEEDERVEGECEEGEYVEGECEEGECVEGERVEGERVESECEEGECEEGECEEGECKEGECVEDECEEGECEEGECEKGECEESEHEGDHEEEGEQQEGEHEEEASEQQEGAPHLHFFDCIVQNEQKADANIVLCCLEATLHALKQKFPHVTKLIVQSDNAKNFAGNKTKLLLPLVCSAAGLKLVAYYHNEAQSGKDICDTHFSHQQTQVDAYLVQGEGGRKVSTAKQLAVALTNRSVSNTTVLLVKPNFQAPYRAAQIPPVVGITEFYAAQYTTSAEGNQHIQFYHSLGQNVPSVCVSIPSCHACSLITPMGVEGVNFTGVSVILNSDNESGSVQAMKDKNRYRKRSKDVSKREEQRMKKQKEDQEALQRVRDVYPQCSECLYHFKSPKNLEKHICCGVMMPRDVLSTAMRHANGLLANMDFSVNGAIQRASNLFGVETLYATFEPNFYPGWAHTRRNMQPELTSRVNSIIHECWKAGESKEQGKVKISVDGVFARLDELQLQKSIRLSELPLAGKIRSVYQSIGRKSEAPKASWGKRARPHGDEGSSGRQKKAKISFQNLDVQKDLSKWRKEELEVYLSYHHLKKSGNKSELIKRVADHMQTAVVEHADIVSDV